MSIGIWWHGTAKENVALILKSGFHERSYFAAHLEDALEFGGPYVFEVAIQYPGETRPWQYCCPEAVPPDRIKRLINYSPEVVYEDTSPKWKHIFYFNEYGPDYEDSMGLKQDEKLEELIAEKDGEDWKPIIPWRWMELALEDERRVDENAGID